MAQNYHRHTSAEIKQGMKGKWFFLFQDLAPELDNAIQANFGHVACPVHGGTDGFRFYKDANDSGGGICNSCGAFPTGFKLLSWVLSIPEKEAFSMVAKWYRGETLTPTIPTRPAFKPAPTIDPAVAREYIARVWREALDIKGSPVEKYLINRGIYPENISPILRYHPRLKYIHGKGENRKDYGFFPALIAPFRDQQGNIVCLHRIFLTPDGLKAPVPDAKKMSMTSGKLVGSAIRLHQLTGDTLGVAEGIETAEAAFAISRQPTWATGTAGLMESMWLPESVRHLLIWEDKDQSGRGSRAAAVLEARAIERGITVERLVPPGMLTETVTNIDWLDVLTTLGMEAFPSKWQRWTEFDRYQK